MDHNHESYDTPENREYVARDFNQWITEHFPDRTVYGELTVDGSHYLYGPRETGPFSVSTSMLLASNPTLQTPGLFLGDDEWR